MEGELSSAWIAILLLGAVHGINPGMGWLFAVGLGLQEQRRVAVWRAIGPLAAGHALAIGAVVALAAAIGTVVPLDILKWAVAVTLFAFGAFRLARAGHPRYGGMRMSMRQLTVWSFLMASAHGAGLMVLPFVLGLRGSPASMEVHHPHAHHSAHGDAEIVATAGVGADQALGLLATLIHTAGYLAVTGVVAVLVYEWFGLGLLRRLWFNLDRVWAVALIGTALLTPFL
jgi:hypothetical protein